MLFSLVFQNFVTRFIDHAYARLMGVEAREFSPEERDNIEIQKIVSTAAAASASIIPHTTFVELRT